MKEYKPLIEQLVSQTIQLIETEYPNGIRLSLSSPNERIITPKGIYPAFYGCYDWHSAVHSHWQIVRAMRLFPDAEFAEKGDAALKRTLTAENIRVEMQWIAERKSFEMPYGMAWLLMLCNELKEWGTPQALAWHTVLQPMETHAVERFKHYCQKMPMPMRGGLHSQTAFSLGLVWDYAQNQEDSELADLIVSAGRRFFLGDTNINLHYEPSVADFLSPSLAEAELMGRILAQDEFIRWLDLFVPEGFGALKPVEVVDPSNGQLAHWAGLNLSRCWMLDGIANALPEAHRLSGPLRQKAAEHLKAGLPMAAHPDYMISHWVPTFAVYLLSR
ncbi:MAG: hypothetical protein ACI9EW_001816 [Cellvibrionaceae bacterium]|jgi:hypothetical protein